MNDVWQMVQKEKIQKRHTLLAAKVDLLHHQQPLDHYLVHHLPSWKHASCICYCLKAIKGRTANQLTPGHTGPNICVMHDDWHADLADLQHIRCKTLCTDSIHRMVSKMSHMLLLLPNVQQSRMLDGRQKCCCSFHCSSRYECPAIFGTCHFGKHLES